MSERPLRHIIHIASPDASKRGSFIMLEQTEENEAIKVAHKLARGTGRRITLQDATLAVIETIAAASVN
jgi:hypothetical protein